jgi:CheY-like chemotaxis protein
MIDRAGPSTREALQDYNGRVRRFRPRVLLAEDDACFRFVLQQFLEGDGYRVTGVATGPALAECLATMSQSKDCPSVVISDDRLPGLRGLHALQQARERGWTRPFVLITAFGSAELAREADRSRVSVLCKPFEIDALRSLVGWLAPRIDQVCVACGSPDALRPVAERAGAMFCEECRGLIAIFDRPVDLADQS